MLALLGASLVVVPDKPVIVSRPSITGSGLLDSEDTIPEIPQRSVNVSKQLLKPFIEEAAKRRDENVFSEPEYAGSIDWELNKWRVNFVFYGWGETHEPPFTERAFIGSISIASIDTRSGQIDWVSFTHDIRAPEVERYKASLDKHDGNPIKIYRAYHDGGLPLLRQVVQNVSGLSADFMLVFDDDTLKDAVDVLGGIAVDVPEQFDVAGFYFKGKKYGDGRFDKGAQKMDGLRVLQFIKTVPKAPKGTSYPKSLEHNARKHLVLKAMMNNSQENITNPLFLWRIADFLKTQAKNNDLESDFDIQKIFTNNLLSLAVGLGRYLTTSGENQLGDTRTTTYIVDSAHGDGGVQWVNSSQNPVIVRELRERRYSDLSFEVPLNGDPYALDLVKNYWSSVGDLIKRILS